MRIEALMKLGFFLYSYKLLGLLVNPRLASLNSATVASISKHYSGDEAPTPFELEQACDLPYPASNYIYLPFFDTQVETDFTWYLLQLILHPTEFFGDIAVSRHSTVDQNAMLAWNKTLTQELRNTPSPVDKTVITHLSLLKEVSINAQSLHDSGRGHCQHHSALAVANLIGNHLLAEGSLPKFPIQLVTSEHTNGHWARPDYRFANHGFVLINGQNSLDTQTYTGRSEVKSFWKNLLKNHEKGFPPKICDPWLLPEIKGHTKVKSLMSFPNDSAIQDHYFKVDTVIIHPCVQKMIQSTEEWIARDPNTPAAKFMQETLTGVLDTFKTLAHASKNNVPPPPSDSNTPQI